MAVGTVEKMTRAYLQFIMVLKSVLSVDFSVLGPYSMLNRK